jgi:hypothetical protein
MLLEGRTASLPSSRLVGRFVEAILKGGTVSDAVLG